MQLAEREQEWQHQRRKDQSAHAEVEWQFQTKIEELKIQVEDLTSSLKRAEDSSEKANNMAADLANEMKSSHVSRSSKHKLSFSWSNYGNATRARLRCSHYIRYLLKEGGKGAML